MTIGESQAVRNSHGGEGRGHVPRHRGSEDDAARQLFLGQENCAKRHMGRPPQVRWEVCARMKRRRNDAGAMHRIKNNMGIKTV